MRRLGRRNARRGGWSLLFGGRRDAARPRSRRRLVLSLLALLFVVGGLGAAALWALPLRSEELTQRLRQEIDRRLPAQLGLSISRASLGLSRSGVVVDIDDVAFRGPTASIASVARLEVTLDPLALVSQRIVPTRLVFERPEIAIPGSSGDRNIDLGGEALQAALERLLRFVGTLEGGLGDAEIAIRDGVIVAPGGRRFENVEISAGRDPRTGRVVLEAADGVRTLSGRLERAGAEMRVEVTLASIHETIRFGHRISREVVFDDASLTLDATLSADGFTGEALLRAAGLGPDGRRFSIDAPCQLSGAVCAVDEGRVAYGASGGSFSGRLGYDGEMRGAPTFSLASRDVRLEETELAPPLEGAQLALQGSFLTNRPGVAITRGSLIHGDQEASLSGIFALSKRSPELALAFEATGLSADLVKQAWPRFLASGARGWVLDHISDATVGPATGHVRVEADALDDTNEGIPLPAGAIAARILFANASFDYVDGLPAIEGAAGEVVLGAQSATITLSEGVGRLGSAPSATLERATFAIADTRAKPAIGVLDAAFSLSVPMVYALRGPLERVATALPKGMDGRGDVALSLRFPLQADMPADAIFYDVAAAIEQATVPDVYDGKPLTDGRLTLRANPAAFDLGGEARLGGLPVRVALFGGETGVEAFSATLDAPAERFRALGVDVTAFLTGPISVSVAGNDPAEGVKRLTVDFSETAVTLPGRGRIKAAGTPATLVSELRTGGDAPGLSLADMTVDATTFRARGHVDIAPGGDLDAVLDAFVIGQDDRGSARIRTRGASTSVSIAAQSLDARPVLDWIFASEGGSSTQSGSNGGSTSVEVNADQVIGHQGKTLSGLSLQLDLAGSKPALLAARGVLDGGAAVRMSLRREQGRGVVSLTAANAGEALRFIDIYERVNGGELGIEASLADNGATFGNISIWNFEIADEVGLEVLTNDAADDRRNTLAFDRLRIPFSHADGRAKIGEGFIRGPAAGATFTGGLDLRDDTLSIRGTFVPLYILNNVFSRVPVVGSLLGSRRREGLFGITFAMDGPISGPTLRVNPLSAIAPGIFRQIFEFGPATE